MKDVLNNVFVIHVSEGYEERRKHIDAHLPQRGIQDWQYILDGDIKDLTDELKDRYFFGAVRSLDASISCNYKHLLAYQEIASRNLNSALIFEDDVILCRNFKNKLEKYIDGFDDSKPYLINIEATNSRVPIVFRRPGQNLYLTWKTKLAGGYIINASAARLLIEYTNEQRHHVPIDAMHTIIAKEKNIDIYWADPPLLTQGSKSGKFNSVLSNKPKRELLGRITEKLRKSYNGLIVSNCSLKRIRTFPKR